MRSPAASPGAVQQQGAPTLEISRNIQQVAMGTAAVTQRITTVSGAMAQVGEGAGQVARATQDLSRDTRGLDRQVEAFLATIRADG